ncbi:terminase small subunit [Pseudooceanicola marinus]|uniref:terminase small subunit n=1 Tax=Pseudooceanicola marinus TaxID=396013 RepID=UPI001CD5B9B3|nr:terminase small subunit [Pseudooceanicola marinus]MCA1337365.1 terminase small subunit [Pseudooceanicola marinus]
MSVGFDLEAALRQFPLPNGQEDTTVNRRQCALALNVSEPMITRYLEQGLPVLSRGTNGQAYEFRLAEVYAWKLWRDEESRQETAAAEDAAMQMRLLFRNDDEEVPATQALTAKQIAEEADADYRRNRAAELRGELTRTERVRELFDDVLSEFRQQVTTLVDFAEMEFSLEPDQVEKMQRRCDAALTGARQRFEQTFQPGEVTSLARRDETG